MKLTAELPIAAGMILVRQTPDGAFAWATGSTAMTPPATGTAESEIEAHLLALEAFLDHPDHADRRLAIDVEDTPAGHALVEFAAKHLPRIPAGTHGDLRANGERVAPGIWDVLSELLAPPEAEAPSPPVRVVGAVGSSRVIGQPAAGWAWVTSDGRWRTGTIRNRRVVTVEVIALLRFISSFPQADSMHVGCGSRPALALIHQVRTKGRGINAAMTDLNLHHPRYQRMFEILVSHEGDITFQWVPDDPRHVLTHTADRLAVQARRALQSRMPEETFVAIQQNIMDDLHDSLGTTREAAGDDFP